MPAESAHLVSLEPQGPVFGDHLRVQARRCNVAFDIVLLAVNFHDNSYRSGEADCNGSNNQRWDLLRINNFQ
ncbi:hypothetical protein P3T35_001034 [Kitasatospora sp. GP30]|uniref:hypothetical protein n=1 Tax=Kitasatospora sp. GP30 TaxID=3035084 RepID=UPI0015D58396|nr:hypothetical protein [Kitasatospora sp. GP30]MDH6139045.1 hypothetical protein [Kitasatospora sp. GP30]